MTKKIKDLAVVVGSYMSDGKKKNRYMNVGYVLQLDTGGELMCLNRTFSPAGVPNPENRDTVIINSFEIKSDDQGSHKGLNKDGDVASNPVTTDEIPF